LKRTSGFSLLELMVALLFMGLLLSGMIRVYVAALKGWNRVNESLTAQRALRWAMDRVAEDLRMMGYLFPPPELRSLEVAASADPTLQSSFMLVPGRPGGGTEDELSFVMDLPVPVQAVLERAIAGSGPEGRTGPGAPAEVRVRPARKLRLQAGDLFLVAGDRFEFAQVAVPVELPAARAGPAAPPSPSPMAPARRSRWSAPCGWCATRWCLCPWSPGLGRSRAWCGSRRPTPGTGRCPPGGGC
jgi:hypothetical protein